MPVPDDVTPMTVSQITLSIKARLEEFYASVWVVGEIVDFNRAASGHYYFNLKDSKSLIRCVMWRGVNLRLKFTPCNGMSIIVRGGLSLYQQRGDVQLDVSELHLVGQGEAELALRELQERLRAKGYFRPDRKRSLPRFPRLVALITSPIGDALRDMLELIDRRWPLTRVIVCPSRVQGETAAAELTARLRMLYQLLQARAFKLDAIVIGRGGGSAEELMVFNDEALADAIYESPVPVVSAIGHETDVTIADFVADVRAETPSAAIMTLMPNWQEIEAQLENRHQRLRESILNRVRFARQRVEQLTQRAALRKPLERLRDLSQRLDDTAERLQRAVQLRLKRAQEQLSTQVEQLDALSPLGVLKRGYSLTHRSDGALLTSATDVAPGDVLRTRVAQGEVLSTVTGVAIPERPMP
jgi:exodeoxyribonuclease VII large subunit